MSLIDGLQDKLAEIQRCTTTPSGTGGVTRVWNTILTNVPCKIAKPSEQYLRELQGANFVTDSVLYVVFGFDIRENDRVVNIFDENSQSIMMAARNGEVVPLEFLVETAENPGGESDYLRCSLKRWGGLEIQ